MNLEVARSSKPATDSTFPDADTLNRVVKIAVDSGEVPTIEAAYDLNRTYRMRVRVGREAERSAPHQAALLTIINIARRALLGGVFVEGNLDAPLLVPLPGHQNLGDAVRALGGQPVESFPELVPTLLVGSAGGRSDEHAICLSIVFSDWRGGIVPQTETFLPATADAITPAAILAGALGVSEIFQHFRGNPMAGRRRIGISLWSPDSLDWEEAPVGPADIVFPSRLWLIGLGHLGQAYLWVLGLLPYQNPGKVLLMLQDFDFLVASNESTSLLTNERLIDRLKTRSMAEWAEARGFQTRLVERKFPGGLRVDDREPRLALGGVDNPPARAAYEDAGFDWIVEAGLGAGPVEYLAIRLHTFPASTSAREKWGGINAGSGNLMPDAPAYQQLSADGLDECGLVQLASRTVGAPFVGTVAATLVIGEVIRYLNGGPRMEVIDMTLRDPLSRSVVPLAVELKTFNPGYTL